MIGPNISPWSSRLAASGQVRKRCDRQKAICGVALTLLALFSALRCGASWISVCRSSAPTLWVQQRPSRARTTRGACAVGVIDLPHAYAKLGLEVGAELAEIKAAFRKLARENHPDLCADPADLAAAGARFTAIKCAYDEILEHGFGEPCAPPISNLGQCFDGFKENMATGRGHHKISDGRLYELWLDLRGLSCGERLENARMEAMSLFFKTRGVVDELGVSLVKEGTIAGIVADDPGALDEPDSADARRLKAAIAGWDHSWVPLFLVRRNADGRDAVWEARSGAFQAFLRPALDGDKLLARPGGTQADADEFMQDLVLAAASAKQARQAQVRYGFAMRALVLTSEPASWAVAGSAADPDKAFAVAQALERRDKV